MKKLLILSFVAATLLFTNCTDFLTEEPVMSQSTELTLASFDGLNNATFGAYSPLVSVNWYGASFVLDAEMRSGNGYRDVNKNSGRYTVPYDLNYTSTATPALWGTAYYTISAVNNVLANLDDKAGKDGVTQEQVNNLKAECMFLRAFAHFDLVRTYGKQYTIDKTALGVPYLFVTDPAGKPERDNVETVYNNIEKDLTDAEKLIAANYTRDGVANSKSVVSKLAIQALLSRVYLYMGEWQKAADYATTVINSGEFSMWTADKYAAAFKEDTREGGEVIFEVYGLKSNEYDGYWDGISYMTDPDGYSDCAASNDLISLYDEGDVRGEMFMNNPDKAPTTYWTTKYAGKDKGNPDVSNTIVLRLSEMYLNRAEAMSRGASIAGTTPMADINTIRENRGATPYDNPSQVDVMFERRLELAWEGHFWYDLARTGGSITRTHFSGSVTNQNVPSDSKYWALPINKREMDVNENLVQNPGYDN
ncbi:RagB/SusD domain-containing protein [Mariniphaga anaerophila]|uniref:RagB/SusD domain-containing protein n=1 Tax=Mariniphaga anaerophila TaxID=1484053 RepID=A0A1M4VPE8_9BACT|nr:RagB/SusD family nutrient uptake outer membrane protein [Mariniphaga anaerophila]SHE70808.1 RagB/SusD domain-containing protein [Mariniphaga anaerophila]